MRVVAVVFHLDPPRLVRAAVDDSGIRRTIDYRWESYPDSPLPETFRSSLEGECEHLRAVALSKAQGRHLP